MCALHTNRVSSVTSGHCSNLYSWDPETPLSLCMLCQAPHRTPASRRSSHSAGFYTAGRSCVDQMMLCVMLWEELALVLSESPHLLALCLNFQPLESLVWVKTVVPHLFFFFSLVQGTLFNIKKIYGYPTLLIAIFSVSDEWKKVQNKPLKSQWCFYTDSYLVDCDNTLIYLTNSHPCIWEPYLLSLGIMLCKPMDSWISKSAFLLPPFPLHIPRALSPGFMAHWMGPVS